jgi:hypothetical protein
MLTSPISVTYNSVAQDLSRVKESNYASEYFFRSDAQDLVLQVGHTLPNGQGTGEGHVVTLWNHMYDAEGVETLRQKVNVTFKTYIGKQDSTELLYLYDALAGVMASIKSSIIERES